MITSTVTELSNCSKIASNYINEILYLTNERIFTSMIFVHRDIHSIILRIFSNNSIRRSNKSVFLVNHSTSILTSSTKERLILLRK